LTEGERDGSAKRRELLAACGRGNDRPVVMTAMGVFSSDKRHRTTACRYLPCTAADGRSEPLGRRRDSTRCCRTPVKSGRSSLSPWLFTFQVARSRPFGSPALWLRLSS